MSVGAQWLWRPGEMAEARAAVTVALAAGDYAAVERHGRELQVLQGQTTQSNYTWCPPPARWHALARAGVHDECDH